MLLPPYSYRNDSLGDCLLDLSVRFVVNCPAEDLRTAERLFFQVEEAHWFYEDFVRLDNPQFPSMKLRTFVDRLFNACPFLLQYQSDPLEAFNSFQSYKSLIPVRGGIILNADMTKVLMVKGWKSNSSWGFPKGKINKDEPDSQCAIREVYEECGFDMTPYLVESDYLEVTRQGKNIRLYVIRGVPEDTVFETQTRKEISKISWHTLNKLPFFNRKATNQHIENGNIHSNYYMAAPFMAGLKKYISKSKGLATSLTSTQTQALENVLGTEFRNDEDAAMTLLGLLKKPAEHAPAPASDTAILLNLIKSDHKTTTDLESVEQVLGLYAQQQSDVPTVEPTKIVLPAHYSSLESAAIPTPPLPPSSILQDLVSARHNTRKPTAQPSGLLSILNGQPSQQPTNDLLSLLQPATGPAPVDMSLTSQTPDLMSLLSKDTSGSATPMVENDLMKLIQGDSTVAPPPSTISAPPLTGASTATTTSTRTCESLLDLLNPPVKQEAESSSSQLSRGPRFDQKDIMPAITDLGNAPENLHLLDLLNKPKTTGPYPSHAVLLEYLSKATST